MLNSFQHLNVYLMTYSPTPYFFSLGDCDFEHFAPHWPVAGAISI